MECTICFSSYQPTNQHTPHILPCGHSFCYQCIVSLIALNSSFNGSTTCPICKKSHRINNVGAVPKNFTLLELLETTKNPSQPQVSTGMHCGFCQDRHEGTHQCLDCGDLLCEKLAITHLKFKNCQNHRVMALPSSSSGNRRAHAAPGLCSEHPRNYCEFYDATCKKAICKHCISRNHSDHQIFVLQEAIKNQKVECQQIQNKLATQLAEVTSEETKTWSKISLFNSQCDEKRQLIDQTFNDLIQRLERRRGDLHHQLNEISRRQSQPMHQYHETLSLTKDQTESLSRRCNNLGCVTDPVQYISTFKEIKDASATTFASWQAHSAPHMNLGKRSPSQYLSSDSRVSIGGF
jgi:hypothetical protein